MTCRPATENFALIFFSTANILRHVRHKVRITQATKGPDNSTMPHYIVYRAGIPFVVAYVLFLGMGTASAAEREGRSDELHREYISSCRARLGEVQETHKALAIANRLVDYCISQSNTIPDLLRDVLEGISAETVPLTRFNSRICFKWASLLESLELYDDAILLRREFARLRPSHDRNPANLWSIAQDLKRTGKRVEALETLINLASHHSSHPEAKAAMRAIGSQGDSEAVLKAYHTVLEHLPEDADEIRNRWKLEWLFPEYSKSELHEEAAEICEEVLASRPNETTERRAALRLAEADLAKGEHELGIAICERLIERHPDTQEGIEARVLKGRLCGADRRIAAARKAFISVIDGYPLSHCIADAVRELYELELDPLGTGKGPYNAAEAIVALLENRPDSPHLGRAVMLLLVAVNRRDNIAEIQTLCLQLQTLSPRYPQLQRWVSRKMAELND